MCAGRDNLELLAQLLTDGDERAAIGVRARLDRLTALTGHPVPVLILSAHETDETVHAKVKAVLIKSRMSEARIVETILSLVGEGQFQQQEES